MPAEVLAVRDSVPKETKQKQDDDSGVERSSEGGSSESIGSERRKKTSKKKMLTNDAIVSRVVRDKLELYINRECRENRWDPSGLGVLRTNYRMYKYDLAYRVLETTELERVAKRKRKEEDTKKPNTGSQSLPISPRLENTSRKVVLTRDVDRLSQYASDIFQEYPVEKLHAIHRYRPHTKIRNTPSYGRVQNYSRRVGAFLHTENYLKYYLSEGLHTGNPEQAERFSRLSEPTDRGSNSTLPRIGERNTRPSYASSHSSLPPGEQNTWVPQATSSPVSKKTHQRPTSRSLHKDDDRRPSSHTENGMSSRQGNHTPKHSERSRISQSDENGRHSRPTSHTSHRSEPRSVRSYLYSSDDSEDQDGSVEDHEKKIGDINVNEGAAGEEAGENECYDYGSDEFEEEDEEIAEVTKDNESLRSASRCSDQADDHERAHKPDLVREDGVESPSSNQSAGCLLSDGVGEGKVETRSSASSDRLEGSKHSQTMSVKDTASNGKECKEKERSKSLTSSKGDSSSQKSSGSSKRRSTKSAKISNNSKIVVAGNDNGGKDKNLIKEKKIKPEDEKHSKDIEHVKNDSKILPIDHKINSENSERPKSRLSRKSSSSDHSKNRPPSVHSDADILSDSSSKPRSRPTSSKNGSRRSSHGTERTTPAVNGDESMKSERMSSATENPSSSDGSKEHTNEQPPSLRPPSGNSNLDDREKTGTVKNDSEQLEEERETRLSSSDQPSPERDTRTQLKEKRPDSATKQHRKPSLIDQEQTLVSDDRSRTNSPQEKEKRKESTGVDISETNSRKNSVQSTGGHPINETATEVIDEDHNDPQKEDRHATDSVKGNPNHSPLKDESGDTTAMDQNTRSTFKSSDTCSQNEEESPDILTDVNNELLITEKDKVNPDMRVESVEEEDSDGTRDGNEVLPPEKHEISLETNPVTTSDGPKPENDVRPVHEETTSPKESNSTNNHDGTETTDMVESPTESAIQLPGDKDSEPKSTPPPRNVSQASESNGDTKGSSDSVEQCQPNGTNIEVSSNDQPQQEADAVDCQETKDSQSDIQDSESDVDEFAQDLVEKVLRSVIEGNQLNND